MSIFNDYDTVLFDADGVLWRADSCLEGVPELFQKLKNEKKNVFIISNNATKDIQKYVVKCNKMNITIDKNYIISSGFITRKYLLSNLKLKDKVYVIGSEFFMQSIQSDGFDVINIIDENPLPDESYYVEGKYAIDASSVFAVIISLDLALTYKKIATACYIIKNNANCLYIVTNTDTSFPMSNGNDLPGAGSLFASIKENINICGDKPYIEIGKPYTHMFEYVYEQFNLKNSRVLMVGDRLETDILFANNCKIDSLLVLTGITNETNYDSILKKYKDKQKDIKPTYILKSLVKTEKKNILNL